MGKHDGSAKDHRQGTEHHGLHDADQTRKDRSYSPASGRETEELQEEPTSASPAMDEEVDPADVTVLPGTGGPDDAGDTDAGGDVDPRVDRGRPE